jgi:predicted GIY-YIG superfamily endonuclease
MKYVYLIEGKNMPELHYVGLTNNLKLRLADHNAGRSPHTSRYRPWRLVCYFAFADGLKAAAFETYLKTGSGHEFRNRHLL